MSARTPAPLALAALLAAVLAGPALSQSGPEGGHEGGHGAKLLDTFAEIDMNADGQISAEEIDAHRAARFAAADANQDGALDATELATMHEAEVAEMLARRSAMMIERHDDNGDGTLSADELGEGPLERRFAVLDTDNDGLISQAEAEAAEQAMDDRHSHRKQGHKGGQNGGMGGWFN